MFQDFSNWKIDILCIFWFNILRLFIPHTYIQNSLHFNSPFSPLACQIHKDKKRCHLPSIFRRHIPSFNIVVSSNPNHMSWLQPRKGGLHFILSDNGNYDFDVKVRRCEFLGFVNDVLDCGCLGCVFCFKIKKKKNDTFYINFYSIILVQSFFFFFSLLQLNSYNGYVCAIYNCCFLWWIYY